jgi:hypothetical protein
MPEPDQMPTRIDQFISLARLSHLISRQTELLFTPCNPNVA